MTYLHIVAFKTSSPEGLAKLTESMLALEDLCTKPEGAKLIQSVKAGKQISPEGKDDGMQVVFVVEFATKEDCDHYLWDDEAHKAFKASYNMVKVRAEYGLTGVTCLDFIEGQF